MKDVRCTAPLIDAGGGGINVARVLTRLEIPCDALFVHGGYTGRLLKELLAEEAIRAIPVESLNLTRQNISIIDENTQQQYRFIMPGQISEESVWKNVLLQIENKLHQYDFVVGSGSLPEGIPLNFYSEISKIVKEAGKQFVLDTGGAALLNGLHSGAFCIKPNGVEFEQLKTHFGLEKDEQLYQKLHQMGVQYIVHTKGKTGTRLIFSEGIEFFTPTPLQIPFLHNQLFYFKVVFFGGIHELV